MASCSPYANTLKTLMNTLKIHGIKVVSTYTYDYDAEENSDFTKTERQKPFAFDVTAIKFSDIFQMTSNLRKSDKLFSKIAKDIKNNKVVSLIQGAADLAMLSNKNPMLDGMDDMTDEEAGMHLVNRSIVMQHVFKAIKSTKDEENTNGLTQVQRRLLVDSGTRQIPVAGNAMAIGMEIAVRHGFKVEGSEYNMRLYYHTLGMAAIEELATNTGIITMNVGTGSIINTKWNKDATTKLSPSKKVLEGRTTIELDVYKMLGVDPDEKGFNINDHEEALTNILALTEAGKDLELSENENITPELEAVFRTAKYISRMSVPANIISPTFESSSRVTSKDLDISPPAKRVLKKLQSKALYVNNMIAPMFKFLGIEMEKARKSSVVSGDLSFESAIKKLGISEEAIQQIFGTVEEYNDWNADSKIGQSISKMQTIQYLADNSKDYWNEDGSPLAIYFEQQMYRTSRVQYLQSLFNGQIDGFFSRFMVHGEPATVPYDINNQSFIQLVNGIEDVLSFNGAEIAAPSNNKDLVRLIKEFNAAFKDDTMNETAKAKAQAGFMESLVKSDYIDDDGSFSIETGTDKAWEALGAIEALSDIYDAEINNTDVETKYHTKPDATASGVFIQILQAVGMSIEDAVKILDNLGYGNNVPTLDDIYALLTNAFEAKENKGGSKEFKIGMQQADAFEAFGFVSKLRDLAKMPMMIAAYLAGEAAVKSESAKAYMEMLVKSIQNGKVDEDTTIKYKGEEVNALDFLKELVSEYGNEDLTAAVKDVKSLQELLYVDGAEIAIRASIQKNAGAYSYSLISEVFTGKITDLIKGKIKPRYDAFTKLFNINRKAREEARDNGDPMPEKILIRTLPAMIRNDINEIIEESKQKRKYLSDKDIWAYYSGLGHKASAIPAQVESYKKDMMRKSDQEFIDLYNNEPYKFLAKYGMKIMSQQNVLLDNEVVMKVESPNYITALVNVIHSIDSAIQFVAHRRTMQEIDDQLEKLYNEDDADADMIERYEQAREAGSIQIHDANSASPVYNALFQKHYRTANVDINIAYDMEAEISWAFDTTSEFMGAQDDTKTLESVDKVESEKRKKIKEKVLNERGVDSEKAFGFDDTINTSGKSTKQKNKKKKKTTQSNRTSTKKTNTGLPKWREDFLNNFENKLKFRMWTELGDILYEMGGVKVKGKEASDKVKQILGRMTGEGKTRFRNLMTQHSEAVKDLMRTGEEFISVDTEYTFGDYDKNNNGQEILQIHIRKSKFNKNTGKIETVDSTTIETSPTNPDQYNVMIEKANADKLAKWAAKDKDKRGSKPSPYLLADSFTGDISQDDMNKQIADALNKYKGDGKTKILAYNGMQADFVVMSQRTEEIDALMNDDLELVDPAYYLLQETADEKLNAGDQKTMADHFGVKEKQGHAAEFDVDVLEETIDAAQTNNPVGDVGRAQGSVKRLARNDQTGLLGWFSDNIISKISSVVRSGTEFAYDPKSHVITIPSAHDFTDAAKAGLTKAQAMAHEVYHFATVGYLGTKSGQNSVSNKYYENLLKEINKMSDAEIRTAFADMGLDMNAADRVIYAKNQDSMMLSVAELSAMIATEGNLSDEILSFIDQQFGKNKGVTAGLAAKMVKAALKYLKVAYKLDPTVLSSSNAAKAAANILFEANNMDEDAKAEGREEFDSELNAVSSQAREEAMNVLKQHADYATILAEPAMDIFGADFIMNSLDNIGINMARNISATARGGIIGRGVHAGDKYFSENFPLYLDNRQRIKEMLEGSEGIGQLMTFMNEKRTGAEEFLGRITGIARNSEAERGTIDNKFIAHMKKVMKKAKLDGVKITESHIEGLYWDMAQSPVFDLMNADEDFNELIKASIDEATFNAKMTELINKHSSKISTDERRLAQEMANMLTQEDYAVKNKLDAMYNTDLVGKKKNKESLLALIALLSMKNTGTASTSMKILSQNTNLQNLIVDGSLMLKDINTEIQQSGEKARWRQNLTRDIYENSWDIRPVSQGDLSSNKYPPQNGWLVLRAPTAKTAGIVYREDTEATFQHGPGTSISYNNADVLLYDDAYQHFEENTVLTSSVLPGASRKLVLTRAEKRKLGLVQNPADAIYRSYSRLREIQRTQVIRDALIMDGFTDKINTLAQLEDYDKSLEGTPIEEIQWLIKLAPHISANDVFATEEYTDTNGKIRTRQKYPNLSRRYTIPEKKSTVRGFNTKYDLVRKDMVNLVSGFKDPVLFKDNPMLKRWAYGARELVKMTKIVWTALDPTKIARDLIANIGILAGYGVGVGGLLKFGKKGVKESRDFENLRIKQLEALMRRDKAGARKLQKEIDEHEFSFMLHGGLFSSINIELFVKDEAVVSGIQKDANKIFDKFLKSSESGEPNSPANIIMAFSRWGLGIDHILGWLGAGASHLEFLETLGERLTATGQRISDIKAEKDVNAYLSEILALPQSQAVQFGSSLVQQIDIISRYVLVKDLIAKGMNEADAVNLGRYAFIDYNKNMPKWMKFLSDFAVLLFPSFWTRMGRTGLSILEHNPARFGVSVGLSELMFGNAPDYISSTVLKYLPYVGNESSQLINAPAVDTPFWFLD